MPQRTVTGPVVDAAGLGIPSGELHITPVVPAGFASDGFVVQTHVYTITNGDVNANVVVPGSYKFDIFDEDGDRIRTFTANVADQSLAPISLKEVWESRNGTIEVQPPDVREGDSVLRLSPGGGLCGQVLMQHNDKLHWGDMQCGGSGTGDMKATTYDPGLKRTDVYNRANHTGVQPHTTVTGLGNAATKNVGSESGTVAAGDHAHPTATPATPGFLSTTDKTKLDGIAPGATANHTNEYLLNRLHHTGTQPHFTITGLGNAATRDVGTGGLEVAAGNHGHPTATAIDDGFMSPQDKAKLDTIAEGATVNATDAQLRDRATHTGTQPHTTVTGLGDAATKNVGTGSADVAAGNHTHANATTSVAGFLSAADKTKLDGVAAGATANSTDAQLRDRGTHTGAQAISTVTGLQAALDGKANLVGGKLDPGQLPALGINDVFTVNNEAEMVALTAQRGDVAVRVDESRSYMLSTDDPTVAANWVFLRSPSGGVSSVNGKTGAVTLLAADITDLGNSATRNVGTGSGDVAAGNHSHANATTSVSGFMSATDKTKLDGVASGATANSTDAQLRDRGTHTGTQAHTTITGLGDAATKNVGTGSGDVAAGNHSHANATTSAAGFMSTTDKTKLDGVASGATANSTDAQLRDRGTHTGTQAISTVTGLQTALNGKADLLANGKVDPSQLPAIAINDVFTVGSLGAMLALTAERGDIAIRTDEAKSYVLKADDPAVADNWVHLQSPSGGVASVNGQVGVVTITAAGLGAATQSALDAHLTDTDNPHDVTPAQIGAATSTALSTHIGDTSNPHAVTAAQAGAVALTGNETVAGNKTFTGEVIPSMVRFQGSAGATTVTNYLSNSTVGGVMTMRLWSIGNTAAKVNGIEIVNNNAGSQSNYVRGYIYGKVVFQLHSGVAGSNSDNPDFFVKTRLLLEHSAMPDSQPNILIRTKTGQTGDAISVTNQSDATIWRVQADGKALFPKLNISSSTPPASPNATGTPGDVTWDTDYLHVCTAPNSWKKAALDTTFTQGGTITGAGGGEPMPATGVVVWRAPFACKVKAVYGFRHGGNTALINARRKTRTGTDTDIVPGNFNLASGNEWMNCPITPDITFAADDALEIVVLTADSVDYVSIQVEFER